MKFLIKLWSYLFVTDKSIINWIENVWRLLKSKQTVYASNHLSILTLFEPNEGISLQYRNRGEKVGTAKLLIASKILN